MILLGQTEMVTKWVVDRLPGPQLIPMFWHEAIGFLNSSGNMAGGVVYFDYRGHDIEAMAAGEGLWLTPLNLKTIFLYPFVQMKCQRMTCHVARNNHKSRKFVQRLGFKLEGKRRLGLPDGTDQMIYGLLRDECRWIDGQG